MLDISTLLSLPLFSKRFVLSSARCLHRESGLHAQNLSRHRRTASMSLLAKQIVLAAPSLLDT